MEHFHGVNPGGLDAYEAARLGAGPAARRIAGDVEARTALIATAPPRRAALTAAFCARRAERMVRSLPPAGREVRGDSLRASALLDHGGHPPTPDARPSQASRPSARPQLHSGPAPDVSGVGLGLPIPPP